VGRERSCDPPPYTTVRRAESVNILCLKRACPGISGASIVERPQDAVYDASFVRNE
jgi:hypothetical protein